VQYLIFTLLFILIHTIAYTVAGAVALRFSKDIYEGENRLFDFLRDMNSPEGQAVSRWFLPAQLLRGLLLSIVLWPILGLLGQLPFGLQFLFFTGLMFFYTDFAGAVPFAGNIEGYVYMKEKYLNKTSFWKMQAEMLIYSPLFGLLAALFLV
jgi:hypothetical protein